MNLYHKVEAAFDGMADALKAAMNVADNSEETELYSDLADDLAEFLHARVLVTEDRELVLQQRMIQNLYFTH